MESLVDLVYDSSVIDRWRYAPSIIYGSVESSDEDLFSTDSTSLSSVTVATDPYSSTESIDNNSACSSTSALNQPQVPLVLLELFPY